MRRSGYATCWQILQSSGPVLREKPRIIGLGFYIWNVTQTTEAVSLRWSHSIDCYREMICAFGADFGTSFPARKASSRGFSFSA